MLVQVSLLVLVVGAFVGVGQHLQVDQDMLIIGGGAVGTVTTIVLVIGSWIKRKMEASERSLRAATEEIQRLRNVNEQLETETDEQLEAETEEHQTAEPPPPQQQTVQPTEAAVDEKATLKTVLAEVLKELAGDTTQTQEIHTMLRTLAPPDEAREVHVETLQGRSADPGPSHDEPSQPRHETKPLTKRQIAKNKSLRKSDIMNHGCPSVHQLRMKEDHANHNRRLRRLSFGPPDTGKPMKTILVVGATGAGKSTLINAFANHLLGVDFEDDYRFRIVKEDPDSDQAVSQTKWVTAYVFYHQDTFPKEFPCSLTIVDTPGFGDTNGIQEDEKIKEQLSHFFHATGLEGIDALDAIGFVVQSSLPRLTPTQQYIFHSILALFGKDIAENIFILATFADGQKPPVIAAVDADNLPYTKCFKFNNSALFAERDSQEDDGVPFDQFFWTMGAASYEKFLTHVSHAKTKSLTLTNEVLDERERLQARVSDLQRQIKMAFATSENLQAALNCFLQHQTDIDRNKDFSFEIKKPKIVTINLENGEYVTNCLKCNITCHYPCHIPDNANKWKCAAMNWPDKGENSTCMICVSSCDWKEHKNTSERFEITEEAETQTVSEMKAKYQEACQQQLSTEDVILKIIEDIEVAETEIVSLVEEVRKSLERLGEIALRPDHMTTSGYIDILIRSEKQQAQPGWQKRVEQLSAVRERADLIRSYAEFHGISEPFQALKKEILDMKTERDAGRLKEGGMIQSITTWKNTTVDWAKNKLKKLRSSSPPKPKGRGKPPFRP